METYLGVKVSEVQDKRSNLRLLFRTLDHDAKGELGMALKRQMDAIGADQSKSDTMIHPAVQERS